MAIRQKGEIEPSEIVGAISKFAGVSIGTAATICKKIAELRVKHVATAREKALSAQVAALESELAAAQRKLQKAYGGEKDAKLRKKGAGKKTKVKKKKKKGKNSSRPQNRPKSKVGVAVKRQKPQPPVAKAEMSGDKSHKTND